MRPPGNVSDLNRRINARASSRGIAVRLIQRLIADTVAAQMLPPGVVKGGAAIQARAGALGSRFTADFDAARASKVPLDVYLEQLEESLVRGWGDFTGTLAEGERHVVDDVPEDYIMRPFNIRLAYRGKHWLSVLFELGRDEIGSTERCEQRLAPDTVDLFREVGLPEPRPVSVLATAHQVVQKLHACTQVSSKTGRNERAHDLVDLQILDQEETIDMAAVNELGTRLFASRHEQAWPPTVVAYPDWNGLYSDAAGGLGVLQEVDAAVEWANGFIARAVEAGS